MLKKVKYINVYFKNMTFNQEPHHEIKTKLETDYTGLVNLGDRTIAWGSNTLGAELDVSSLLNGTGVSIRRENTDYSVYRIYARTETGNIYGFRLTNNGGQMINATTGQEELVVSSSTLRVGEPFTYNKGGTTTTITEIVAASKITKSDTEISNMAAGKESTIAQNFKTLLAATKRE